MRRQEVAEGVLLPVDEVRRGLDGQRIGQDRRAAVRRRPQAHDVRTQLDWTVVAVLRSVCKGDVQRHWTRGVTGPVRWPVEPRLLVSETSTQ